MRQTKKIQTKFSLAVIADGETEKWYLEKVKQHYASNRLKRIKVVPELPQKKKVKELFDFAKEKLSSEYSYTILIIDLDEILKDSREFEAFRTMYEKYMQVKEGKISPRQKATYGWMTKLLIVVNSPCLEYWYLLHFDKIQKFYNDYASLLPDLKRKKSFENYDKGKDFYNQNPDIYIRLGEAGLKAARKNAVPFELERAKEAGFSEMYKIFDYFDE